MLHFNWLQDIQLSGLGILHEHCQLDIEDNEVYVTPLAKTGYVYKQKKNVAGELIILVWIVCRVLITQLVEHCSTNTEAMGSNAVQALFLLLGGGGEGLI